MPCASVTAIQRFGNALDAAVGLVTPLYRFDFELSAVLLGFLPRDHFRHRLAPLVELSMRVH